MDERIKKVRKSLDLTQQKFADRLGVARNNIAGYETGKRYPSEAVISLICREFDVNEDWLRTGEGEMFVPISRDEEIAAFAGRVLKDESDTFKKRFIRMLAGLAEDEWELLERKALELVGDRIKEKDQAEA